MSLDPRDVYMPILHDNPIVLCYYQLIPCVDIVVVNVITTEIDKIHSLYSDHAFVLF